MTYCFSYVWGIALPIRVRIIGSWDVVPSIYLGVSRGGAHRIADRLTQLTVSGAKPGRGFSGWAVMSCNTFS